MSRSAILCALILHTTCVWAGDNASLLLSTNAVLVTADAAPEVASYLTDAWGALVGVPCSDAARCDAPIHAQATLKLAELPLESGAATDTLAAWRARWGFTVALITTDPRRPWLFDAANRAGWSVFRAKSEFKPGDVAIPVAAGYAFYRGGRPQIFAGIPRPLTRWSGADVDDKGARSPGQKLLGEFAGAFDTLFASSEQPGTEALYMLRRAVAASDSLSRETDTASAWARFYTHRWRACLTRFLSLELEGELADVWTGLPTPRKFELHSKVPVPIRIVNIHVDHEPSEITWSSDFPLLVPPLARVPLTGVFTVRSQEPLEVDLRIDCRFEDFSFVIRQDLRLGVRTPLEFYFDPPILFAAESRERSDPDYLIRVATGVLQAKNWSSMPLSFDLQWQAEAPIAIAATQRALNLGAGEAKQLPYTLSIPKELEYKQYTFSATATGNENMSVTTEGHVWQDAPKIAGVPVVGVIGAGEKWLRALHAVGISAVALEADELTASDLHPFHTLIVPPQVASADSEAREVLRSFVQAGNIVLVILSPAAASWFPWAVDLVYRPGPIEARFQEPDLLWWQQPNGLVSGCFAAATRDSVYTLSPATPDWEPLLLDGRGTAYMHRRSPGRGWYIAVHDGWAPLLAKLNRRALLGLVNLVSAGQL